MGELETQLARAGTIAVGEFRSDGALVELRSREPFPEELGHVSSRFAATITMALSTFAASYSEISRIPLVPFQGWLASGGEMTALIRGNVWAILRTTDSEFQSAGPSVERTLDGLLELPGVRFAAAYAPDGGEVAHRQTIGFSRELRATASEFVGTVTVTLKGLALAFSHLSKQEWRPLRLWMYSGGEWTIAASGTRWVLADAGEADLRELYRSLPW